MDQAHPRMNPGYIYANNAFIMGELLYIYANNALMYTV